MAIKFYLHKNDTLTHPYILGQEDDEPFSEELVKETLAWARERGLDIRVIRGWRGDPFGFAFAQESEVDFFMLGRHEYAT